MNDFRIPAETHVSQVRLRTADADRALRFYQGVLGLTVIGKGGNDAALGATKTGPPLILLTEDDGVVGKPLRATGLYHLALRHPSRRDLARALQRLLRDNYPIEGASDHDVSEAIYLSDPDGNGVELYADRPAKGWRWRSGQVEMTTKPLDMAGLLGTVKKGSELDAISAATDLGHIHLHVADLAAAEIFFHDFLGFDVTQRGYPGALFFSAGGYHHHIAVNTWAGRAAPPANSVGLISYRLETPTTDVFDRLRERATAFGFKTRKEVGEPGSSVLALSDPNGIWLEISGPDSASARHNRLGRSSILSSN